MIRIMLILFVLVTGLSAQEFYNEIVKTTPVYPITWDALSPDSIIISGNHEYNGKFDFYTTTDGGDSWVKILQEIITNSRPKITAIGNRVFISVQSMQPPYNPVTFYTDDFGRTYYTTNLAVDITNSEIVGHENFIYTYHNNTFFRSSDQGHTWGEYYQSPERIRGIFVTENNTQYYYDDNALYKHNESNNIWETIFFGKIYNSAISLGNDLVFRYFKDGKQNHTYYTNGVFKEFSFKENLDFYKSKSGEPYAMKARSHNQTNAIFKLLLAQDSLVQIAAPQKPDYEFPRNKLIIFDQYIYIGLNLAIVFQGEERAPEFETGFFPLKTGNKWFYQQASRSSATVNSLSFQTREVLSDTNINGKTFYKYKIDSVYKYFNYTDEDNVLRELNENGETHDKFSFNIENGYHFNFLNEQCGYYTLGQYYLEPGSDILAGYNIALLKTFDDDNEMEINENYAKDIGFTGYFKLYKADNSSVSLNLLQAKVFDSSGNLIVIDNLEDPYIHTYQGTRLNQGVLTSGFKVYHRENQYYGKLANIIDSAQTEIRFINGSDTSATFSFTLELLEQIGNNCTYSGNLPFDTSLLNVGGGVIQYRYIATTIGAIPHADTTSWMDIIYGTTDLQSDGSKPEFSLSSNYPNPFNPSTRMEFTLPKESDVEISVFNVTGEMLFTATKGKFKAGQHFITINMADYSSGVYFVSMISENKRLNRKIILLK